MENNNNAAPQPPDTPPETSSAAGAEEQEESGWTDYLEDFFNSELIERESSFLCSSIGSCSNWDHNNISYPNYDIKYNINIGNVNYEDVPKSNNLTSKKTRTQKIFEDDDSLQDTATSPIHSPKVVDLKVRTSHENPRSFDDHIAIIANSTGSGRQMGKYYPNKEKGVYSAEKKGELYLGSEVLKNSMQVRDTSFLRTTIYGTSRHKLHAFSNLIAN